MDLYPAHRNSGNHAGFSWEGGFEISPGCQLFFLRCSLAFLGSSSLIQ